MCLEWCHTRGGSSFPDNSQERKGGNVNIEKSVTTPAASIKDAGRMLAPVGKVKKQTLLLAGQLRFLFG